jgi:transcriptional regulator with XRE-family HTH domain
MKPPQGHTEIRKDDFLIMENRLLLRGAEAIWDLIQEQGVSRAELARRLNRTPSRITQILSGEHNMRLRTLADVGYVLDHEFLITPKPL